MAMLDLAAAASQAWLPMLVGTYTDTDSKGIYQYRFNQESGTAELTAVTPARNPSFVIFSDNGDNVYAVDESGTDDDALAAFRYEGIDKPLTRINAVATGGKAPCNIFQTKNLIYTANYTGGSITEFRLADDGSIKKANKVMTFSLTGKAPDKTRQQSAHLHCVTADPPLRMARIRLRPRQRLHLLAQAQRRMRRAGSGQHPICSSRFRATPPHF